MKAFLLLSVIVLGTISQFFLAAMVIDGIYSISLGEPFLVVQVLLAMLCFGMIVTRRSDKRFDWLWLFGVLATGVLFELIPFFIGLLCDSVDQEFGRHGFAPWFFLIADVLAFALLRKAWASVNRFVHQGAFTNYFNNQPKNG